MADVGGLIADVGLNVAQLRGDVQKANRELSRGTNRMNRNLGKLRKRVDSAVGGFKALAAVAGLGLLARKIRGVVAETNELGKAAATAGVTAESLQELRFAFGQLTDVTEGQVDEALSKFTRRLGLAANGSGAAKKAFEELGISTRDLDGNVRRSDEAMDEVLITLARLESDAERAARASEFFGDRVGPKLAVALDGGIKNINEMRDRARELGLVLSNEAVEGAEAAEDRLQELSQSMGKRFQRLIVDNIGLIEGLADAFQGLVDVADFVVDGLGRIGSKIGLLIDDLFKLNRVRLDDITEQIRELEGQLGSAGRGIPEAAIEQRLQELRAERDALVRQSGILNEGGPGPRVREIQIDTGSAMEAGRNIGKAVSAGVKDEFSPERDFFEAVEEANFAAFREAGKNAGEAFSDGLAEFDPERDFFEAVEEAQFRDFERAGIESLRNLSDETGRLQNAFATAGATFESAFEDAILSGRELSDVFSGLLDDLARIALREAILGPLTTSIAGLVGGFFGGTASSADGNVFTGPSVTKIAERGQPEAVFPLTRVGGQLGIQAAGGGGGGDVTVNVISNNTPLEVQSQRQRTGPSGEQIVDVMVEGALNRMASNGKLDSVLQPFNVGRRGIF